MGNAFIWIAILVALPLLVLQLMFGVKVVAEDQGIPLLTLLFMNQFGAILCAIAVGVTVRSIKNTSVQVKPVTGVFIAAAFAIVFIWRLIELYPGGH